LLKCELEFTLETLKVLALGTIVLVSVSSMDSIQVGLNMSPENDWPMFMHDPQHTGYTEELGPADESILWVYDFGSPLFSSPVVQNGILYQGSREYLCALDMNTGAALWKTELAVVGSTPAVNGDILVVATNKGISAVDTRTGDILWMYDIKKLGGHLKGILEYFISSPVITKGNILVGTGINVFSLEPEPEFSRLVCLDVQSGDLVWSKESWNSVISSPAIQNDVVYFTSELLEAVDIESGQEKWYYHPPGWQLMSDPTIAEGIIAFSNPDGVKAVSAHSGDLLWKTDLESGTSALAICGKRLMGSTPTSLICLDIDTGSILWEKFLWEEINLPIDPHYSSPAIARDRVYVGSRNGSVYCVDLVDGTVLWEYETEGPVVASPAVVDGKLYIGSANGKLYCFGTNPDEYFRKGEEYKKEGNTERAREFYVKARDYYQAQGDMEMVTKCEERLKGKSYSWVLIFVTACVFGALLIYWKIHRRSLSNKSG